MGKLKTITIRSGFFSFRHAGQRGVAETQFVAQQRSAAAAADLFINSPCVLSAAAASLLCLSAASLLRFLTNIFLTPRAILRAVQHTQKQPARPRAQLLHIKPYRSDGRKMAGQHGAVVKGSHLHPAIP